MGDNYPFKGHGDYLNALEAGYIDTLSWLRVEGSNVDLLVISEDELLEYDHIIGAGEAIEGKKWSIKKDIEKIR